MYNLTKTELRLWQTLNFLFRHESQILFQRLDLISKIFRNFEFFHGFWFSQIANFEFELFLFNLSSFCQRPFQTLTSFPEFLNVIVDLGQVAGKLSRKFWNDFYFMKFNYLVFDIMHLTWQMKEYWKWVLCVIAVYHKLVVVTLLRVTNFEKKWLPNFDTV